MQAIHEIQACKIGYKLWVADIQFYLYMGKDDFFDPDLGLAGSVIDELTDSLPKHTGSNYHIITDNFITSLPKHAGSNNYIITDKFITIPQLLRSLIEKEIAATGAVWLNRVENVPLKTVTVKEMEKLERRSADVVIDDNTKIAFVIWKNDKVVIVVSSKYWLNPTAKTKRYIKEKKDWVNI